MPYYPPPSVGGSGAPTDATYITQTLNGSLSAEQALSALATGLLKNTTGTGVLSIGAAGTDYVAPSATLAGHGITDAYTKTEVNTISTPYRTLLDACGSHIAARIAGTYGFPQGEALAISGTGTLYALNVIRIDSTDYPTINGVAADLRVKGTLMVNDVAPTGNFTFGLHPVTRPATSGGAGLVIYTIGAAVAGSTFAINTPAADSMNNGASADFALPANGYYVLGVVTTATVAASSHLHLSAKLQLRHA